MATSASTTAFWSDNLQESIQTAGRRNQTLLCFVTDGSAASLEWNQAITTQSASRHLNPFVLTHANLSQFSKAIAVATVRLRIQRDSQEFAFLTGVCPVQSTPSLVSIKNGQIEEKLEHPGISVEELRSKLSERYSSEEQGDEPVEASTSNVEKCLELKPSTGRMRLPNNAYDALRSQTETWQSQSIAPKNILLLQLRLLEKIPTLKETVASIKSRTPSSDPVLPDAAIDRLLNTPATAIQPRQSSPSSTPSATPARTTSPPNTVTPPPSQDTPTTTTSQTQAQQRASYIQLQRSRETAQRQERERIKQQIQNDRIERRRLDAARQQQTTNPSSTSPNLSPATTAADIRIQVRTFDGSTLRSTFPRTARIAGDVRPWVDEHQSQQPASGGGGGTPYNLKLILTPLPNRTIEAGEEDQPLPELGIVGSATFVMVPVRGYVDSYAAAGSGVAMSVFGGLLGAGGRVVDGLLGMIGWGGGSSGTAPSAPVAAETTQQANAGEPSTSTPSGGAASAKIRTLADQRADEERKRGNQLYNGNSLDFQGRKDKDGKPDSSEESTGRKDD